MKRLILITLALCLTVLFPVCGFNQSQDQVDSLLLKVATGTQDTNQVRNLNTLSKYYLTIEPDKSIGYAKQALELAKKLQDKQYIFNAYQDMGAYYYYRTDFKLAEQYFNDALAIAEGGGLDKPSLGKVYSNLSLLAIRRIDYSNAIAYSEKAMRIAEEIRDTSLMGTISNNRGIIYMNIADYPSALNYFLKSLRISEEKNNKQKLATNYYYIGYTYFLQNEYDKAITNFQLSINAARDGNDKFQLAESLDRLGEIYQAKQEWSRALDNFQQAITIGREIGSFDNIISSTQNIAMIYSQQGKYEQAIQWVSNSLELSKQVGEKLGIGNNYGYLGEIYIKEGDYTSAIKNLLQSLQIAREINAKDNQAQVLKDLATCYQDKKDFNTAYSYLQQYQTVKDSIISAATVKLTAEAEAKYELDKKEKEIALLTKDKQIQTLEIKKQTTLKNSLVIGLGLLCILFFFVYRYYRSQQLLKLQTLRNKIASDLHDDVGSTLSSIAIFSEIARQESKEVAPMLEQISENSRKMLESMADIVWTINPDNDNFEKIILRMRSFAFELLGPRKIDFEFNADDFVVRLNLSMDVRKNLYLIFKEAINNLVKYSDADRASFSITSDQGNLTMLIRDNGRGFDTEKPSAGNGLKNMRNRATEMGARFLIESEPGKGTTIQLLMKAA